MQEQSELFDFCGIGMGPFNLGLAALSAGIPGLSAMFVDKKPAFNWHDGMLIDWTRLQVPFYADLVTLADPCSPFSFLNFLKSQNRLFLFAINEQQYILRQEYNQYCRWVAAQLNNLSFSSSVKRVTEDKKSGAFRIQLTNGKCLRAKKLVLGIGTRPVMPELKTRPSRKVFHSSDYMKNKHLLKFDSSCVVIGSGQSAAEIFYDLLSTWHDGGKKLCWYTRSNRFSAMDTNPFSCEHSTPDYIRYFYQLPQEKKKDILSCQQLLFKGINEGLMKEIYDLLYLKLVKNEHLGITLRPNCVFEEMIHLSGTTFQINLKNIETGTPFPEVAEAVIFATGYEYSIPGFVDPVKHMINFTEDGLYRADANYAIDITGNKIFVQNAEMNTHGFNAPDLSLGPYRNGIILNAITNTQHFKFAARNVFQDFFGW